MEEVHHGQEKKGKNVRDEGGGKEEARTRRKESK